MTMVELLFLSALVQTRPPAKNEFSVLLTGVKLSPTTEQKVRKIILEYYSSKSKRTVGEYTARVLNHNNFWRVIVTFGAPSSEKKLSYNYDKFSVRKNVTYLYVSKKTLKLERTFVKAY